MDPITFPSTFATLGISGGAAYDALVAITAADKGATLRTLDTRAERIYRRLGAGYGFVR